MIRDRDTVTGKLEKDLSYKKNMPENALLGQGKSDWTLETMA